jgi:ABC-2 type transport system permease protein
MKFLAGWSAAHGSLTRRRRAPRGLIDILSGFCLFLPRETRRLLALDMKNFLRDPVQWLQTLIFFGLLATYIINLRNLKYDQYIPVWRDWVANINLASTSLTLATFSSRFIFPLLSLEGKRFWCLGILPLSRSSIVMSKFNFSFLTSLLLSIPLIVASDRMLRLSSETLWAHLFILPLICFGLSGLAVGLGARYVDLKSDNPAKIVAGFGGTLNLVLSLMFVVAMIGLQWVTLHPNIFNFYIMQTNLYSILGANLCDNLAHFLPLFCAGTFGVLSGLLPLIIGIRYYNKLEF